jgi:hypothetical protein
MHGASPVIKQFLNAEELVRNKCSKCEYAFSNAPVFALKESSYIFQSQALLSNLFQANPLIALDIPTTNVSVLLWLFLGIKDAVFHAGAEWSFHYKEERLLDENTSNMKVTLMEGELLATAYKALLNWPNGFHSFLDAYRNRPNTAEGHGISREFGILYTTWLKNRWILPQFQFVHDAFNDYVAKYLPPYERLKRNEWAKSYPEIRKESDFISIENAAKEYGCSLMQILRWLHSGNLIKYPASDGIIEYLKRSELEVILK